MSIPEVALPAPSLLLNIYHIRDHRTSLCRQYIASFTALLQTWHPPSDPRSCARSRRRASPMPPSQSSELSDSPHHGPPRFCNEPLSKHPPFEPSFLLFHKRSSALSMMQRQSMVDTQHMAATIGLRSGTDSVSHYPRCTNTDMSSVTELFRLHSSP